MPERTKAQKEASAKKAARTRKKNEVVKEQAKELAIKKRKKTLTAKKKGLMGDFFTPAAAQGAAKTIGMAALGGGIAVVADDLLISEFKISENASPVWLGIAAGLVAVMGYPITASGIAGVAGAKLIKRVMKRRTTTTMEDDMLYLQDNVYVNDIEALPLVLDVNGESMEDNNMNLQDHNNMYLQDDNYDVGYFPSFGG